MPASDTIDSRRALLPLSAAIAAGVLAGLLKKAVAEL